MEIIISWQDEIARLSGQTSELEERLRGLDTKTQNNKATEESRQQATAERAAQREPESCPTESEGELASLQLKIKELSEQNVAMKDHMKGKHKQCQLAHKKKMLEREAVYKVEIDKRASEAERLMERNKELEQRCAELGDRAQELKERLDAEEADLRTKMSEIGALEEKLERAADEKEGMGRQLQELQEKMKSEDSKGKHQKCQLAHKKKMVEREAHYQAQMEQKDAEGEQFRQRAQELEAKCGELEERCRVQGGVCDELRKQLRAAEEAAQVADGKQEGAQVAETRQELESRVVELHEALKSGVEIQTELEKNMAELNMQNKALESTVSAQAEELDAAKRALAAAEQCGEELRAELAALRQDRESLTQYHADQVQQLEARCDELVTRLQEDKDRMSVSTKRAGGYSRRLDSLTRTLTRQLACPLTDFRTHSFSHSITCSLLHPLTRSLPHSIAHPLTCSFIQIDSLRSLARLLAGPLNPTRRLSCVLFVSRLSMHSTLLAFSGLHRGRGPAAQSRQ